MKLSHANELKCRARFVIALLFAIWLTGCEVQESELAATKSQVQLDEQSTPLWQDFYQAHVQGSEPVLPDYSYAGYALGEAGIPDAVGQVFNVADFGAVPNDDRSDRTAIESAIKAAEANGGGVVFFPKGRFLVSEIAGTGNGIEIHGSHIVLKGSGSGPGGTEVFMREHLMPADPNKMWSVPNMFAFKPASGVNVKRKQTTIMADAQRETFQITVADASALQVGMLLELSMKNPAANSEFLDDLEPWDIWTKTIDQGVNVRGERHRIKSIDGQRITFDEPIHCNIVAAHNWTVSSSDLIAGWGVEDIHFVGHWKESFVHHKNFVHDSGWSFMSFFYGERPYVRRSRFTDCSSAVTISGSYGATLINCSIEGNQGHTSFTSGYFSYGTLMAYCVDTVTGGAFHGMAANHGAVGTVITRCKNSDRGFDWHGSGPYCTLIDSCSGGLIGNGGNYQSLPNHMKHLTFWNFNQTAGVVYDQYDWWEPRVGNENYSGAKVVKPTIVGYRGLKTTFKDGTCKLIESHGRPASPQSLYEAQLVLRLGVDPTWLEVARSDYDFFMTNGHWE